MYCYIWEYLVLPEHVEAFRIGYGSDGDWVRLFRRSADYIRTEFLQDRDDPRRFMTVDYWASREACISFRERVRVEFDEIDARFGRLTSSEDSLGEFDVVTA